MPSIKKSFPSVKRKRKDEEFVVVKKPKFAQLSVQNVRRVNRMLRSIELKYLNPTAASDDTLFVSGGTVHTLNAIAQGDTASQRAGALVNMVSIEGLVNVCGCNDASPPVVLSGGFFGLVRFMLIWDKQTNGAAPGVTDVLIAADGLSPKNPLKSQRFQIIYDQTRDLGAGQYSGSDGTATFRIPKIWLNKATQYSGTGGAVTDINTGGLFALMISKSQGTPSSAPSGAYNLLIKYTDD